MDHRPSFRTIPLTVMGVSLFLLLLLFASPAFSRTLEELDPPSNDVVNDLNLDQPVDLLRFLRSSKVYDRLEDTVNKDFQLVPPENRPYRKRGFGIAGLDNVDMITSTLDRSRSRSRNHRPQMSLRVDLNQLRALMAKAG